MRFGDPEEVNYGRGCKVIKTEKSGNDLLITFDGAGNGIKEDEFAAKLLGKTSTGKLLFGYARLPGVKFVESMLSSKLPEISPVESGFKLNVEVQNFGQLTSELSKLKIVCVVGNEEKSIAEATIPKLKPWQKTTLTLNCGKIFDQGVSYNMVVIIDPDSKSPVTLHGKVTPNK